ncbi:MAG: acetate--CoA ligase family protein [Candidatus Krumholzibacteriota bacterium]|nr:acetate--CoA ligase family protein [Candidatus Krumholzibacteriota bacterium]
MLGKKIKPIIERSRKHGWILEPDAMEILKTAGLDLPQYLFAESEDDAAQFADKNGYPVVAKIVSPEIMHKSDVGGVVVGIADEKELREVFKRFSRMNGFSGVIVVEMLKGTELIIGARIDEQFGAVIVLGIGGVAVEIYNDTVIRMAPIKENDVASMVADIRGQKLIKGFRGSDPVDIKTLTSLLIDFSNFVIKLEPFIESIDLNPVICTGSRCIIADARMILSISK